MTTEQTTVAGTSNVEIKDLLALQVAAAEKNLDRIIGWIGRLDNRFPLIVGICLAMIGLLLARSVSFGSSSVISIVVFSIALVLLGGTLLSVYLAVKPRLNASTESMLYFGTVGTMPLSSFKQKYVRQGANEYLQDLLAQIHRNSEIVNSKFRMYNRALTLLLSSAIPWGLALVTME